LSLSAAQPEVVELHLELTPKMQVMGLVFLIILIFQVDAVIATNTYFRKLLICTGNAKIVGPFGFSLNLS
jgi:hypothetical protein